MLLGYGRRTTLETLHFLRDQLIPNHLDENFGGELAEWRINLDGGMVPVASNVVLTHPESLLSGLWLTQTQSVQINVWDMLRDLGMNIIPVTQEESIFKQACNCFCVGDRTIVTYDLSDRVDHELRARGIKTHRIAGSELVKGTGGPRCITKPIHGSIASLGR